MRFASCLWIVLAGCHEDAEIRKREVAIETADVGEAVPGLVLYRPETPALGPDAPVTTLAAIAARDPEATVVVRGRVTSLAAEERMLPPDLGVLVPDVVTIATVHTIESLCGIAASDLLVWTRGGETTERRVFAAHGAHLTIDREYIMILRRRDGEYELGGATALLGYGPDGVATDHAGVPHSLDDLRGACP